MDEVKQTFKDFDDEIATRLKHDCGYEGQKPKPEDWSDLIKHIETLETKTTEARKASSDAWKREECVGQLSLSSDISIGICKE